MGPALRPGRRRVGEARSPIRVFGHSEGWSPRKGGRGANGGGRGSPGKRGDAWKREGRVVVGSKVKEEEEEVIRPPKQLLLVPVAQLSPPEIEAKLKEYYKC